MVSLTHSSASSSPRSSLILFTTLAMPARQVSGVSWVLSHSMSLAISRMDPIVNPGGVAGHVHNVLGGSAFSNNIRSPEAQAASQCSSTNVGADKSNYWAPQLYYRYPDNTYSPMLGGTRIYYFNNGDDVVPFPPNLRMISGLTGTRDANDTRAFGLKIACDHGEQTQFLPSKSRNPGGCSQVQLGIFFPSCGLEGQPIDSNDHFSHLTWPYQMLGGDRVNHPNGNKCPETHPVKYPVIFLEYTYYFSDDQPWRNEDNLLVLSNGDTSGLAFHADFVNGWDQGVLTQAIKECFVGDRVSDCGPFKSTASTEDAWDCRLESQIPAEDVGLYDSLPNLPGCNPLWTEGMQEKPGCASSHDTPGYTYPNAYFRNDKQRVNIPLALPEATEDKLNNPIRPDIYWDLVPKVGAKGASFIKKWGTEAASTYLNVGSTDAVMKWFVNNDGKAVSGDGATGGNAPTSIQDNLDRPSSTSSGTTGGASSTSSAAGVGTTGNANSGTNSGAVNAGSEDEGKDNDEIDAPALIADEPAPSTSSSGAANHGAASSDVPAITPIATPTSGAAAEKETVTVTIDSCKRKKKGGRFRNNTRRGLSEHKRRSRHAH